MTLRVGSLCSGYGGLDLAVESVLDAELAWYAQYEPPDKKTGKPDRHQHAAQIMAHHWPGIPNHGDITAIDYAGVEPVVQQAAHALRLLLPAYLAEGQPTDGSGLIRNGNHQEADISLACGDSERAA